MVRNKIYAKVSRKRKPSAQLWTWGCFADEPGIATEQQGIPRKVKSLQEAYEA